ncbi:MAG: TatD family hydrolase [Treponema sp.]|jgi:TatD DNase family protein|nr:TatD family hydrolase [Treponema sp.]
MQFIDIGVNLMNAAFDRNREAVLSAAKNAGVSPLIITGSSLKSSAGALAFAGAHPGDCRATAGVHPHNAKDWDIPALLRLRELAACDALAAIGECGLDYNRNFSPPAAQRRCFEEQLELAAELGKPVFLHERDAFEDFSAILKKYRPKLSGAVVHCFTGGMKELEIYLAMDCHIGITGWICDERRGAHLVPLVKHIPADKLLLETDAPYLLPRNLPRPLPSSSNGPGAAKARGSHNEPRFLPHIAAFVARALDKETEQLAAETRVNAIRFFGIRESSGGNIS